MVHIKKTKNKTDTHSDLSSNWFWENKMVHIKKTKIKKILTVTFPLTCSERTAGVFSQPWKQEWGKDLGTEDSGNRCFLLLFTQNGFYDHVKNQVSLVIVTYYPLAPGIMNTLYLLLLPLIFLRSFSVKEMNRNF